MRLKTIAAFTVIAAVVLGASACNRDKEQREIEFMPDMYQNPAVKPQEESLFFRDGLGMRMPPVGTVSLTARPYRLGVTEREKARAIPNPLAMTRANFDLGQKYYNIHCRICHGVVGSGDGLATQAHRERGMPIPPQLYSDKIRKEWADGEIFHVITKGQGQMPGYGARIDENHRWAIVLYVRALGEAANPSEEDLKTVEALQRAEPTSWDAREMDDPYRSLGPRNQLYLNSMTNEASAH